MELQKRISLIIFSYTIPASSSPWQTSGTATSELNKQLVHYAKNTTNGANYTWCAATAGCNSETYSICPRGWRLPSSGEYNTLLSSAGISNDKPGSTKIRGTPYNFPYAGRVVSGSLQYVGSWGVYWSSTAGDNNDAYYLYFGSGTVNTYTNGRYIGLSVRCIAP